MLYELKWDLALIGSLICLGIGFVTFQTPWIQGADEATAEGSRPPDRTEGDVLLLLPDGPAARATGLDELDCSYGWYNSLWQFYGSFATALTRNLSPEFLAGRNVVIVPRRVARAMPATGVGALAEFARQGGQLILEQPGPGWEQLTGVGATTGSPQPARSITSVEGLAARGRMRTHLPDVPLAGRLTPAAPADPWPAGPTLLDVNGQPGLLANRHGEGRVYTFLFEFGCTITALQQGRPVEGMRFSRRASGSDSLIPTAERVADESMLQAEAPLADLLEHAVFHRLSEFRPLPRLWPYPDDAAGTFLVSHPTPADIRPTLGYLDWANEQEAPATVFAAPDRLSEEEAALAANAGADMGLLWVRGINRPRATRSIGVGAIRPLARELSLRDQLTMLDMKLPEDSVPEVARVEGARHRADWSTTFRQLAAADLRVDNSFGPVAEDQYGYLFGTGYPFYPVDRQGLPLPILELPFVMHGPNLSRDRLRSMLRASQDYYHQTLTISVPSYGMRRTPSPDMLLAYRDAFDLAEDHDHWVTSMSDLKEFMSARRRSVLTSQWRASSQRLTISVNLKGARLESREGGAIPGIAIPKSWRDHPIERLVIDGEDVSTRRLTPSGPGHESILSLDPGRHTVSVFYRQPPTATSDAGVADGGSGR
jgi:hypothetical protein